MSDNEAAFDDYAIALRSGMERVTRRREAWATHAPRLLAALEKAAEALRGRGVTAEAKLYDVDGALNQSVQLNVGAAAVGTFLHDDGTKEEVLERPAALGYSLAVDGRVGHWQRQHGLVLYDEVPGMIVVGVIEDVTNLAEPSIAGHVRRFLRDVTPTSFRAWSKDSGRIGFAPHL